MTQSQILLAMKLIDLRLPLTDEDCGNKMLCAAKANMRINKTGSIGVGWALCCWCGVAHVVLVGDVAQWLELESHDHRGVYTG